MKKISKTLTNRPSIHSLALLVLLATSFAGFSQNVGINSTGVAPNVSAGLDVDFPDKGVLIPRVALTGTANFAPLTAHVAGMMVYNTATAGDVTPGFYYNNGTKWISGFPVGIAIGNMLYWNGTAWVMIPAGTPGQYLQINASNIPVWAGSAFATITTTPVTAIAATTATSGGAISSDGGSPVLSKGVCWATTTTPTTANSLTSNGTGTATYVSSLSALVAGTIYYVRAYCTNNSVTTYANQLTFSTLATLTTTAATLITSTTATTGGNVTSGNATVIERGVCYGTNLNPTTANLKLVDPAPGPGAFVSNLTGLTSNTLYYVRSYAINAGGTAYGAQISFTTTPNLTTTAITAITNITATSGGTINPGGNAAISSRGVCWSTATGPTTALTTKTLDGTGTGTFTSNMTSLLGGTLYYVRAYAVNAGGTSYGNELTFTTLPATAPIVASTNTITNITPTSATSGGTITNDGGAPITVKGVCWSTSPSPVLGVGNFTSNGTGPGAFGSSITGLTASTVYYVRAYATNSVGTSYGPVDVSFTTCGTPIYTIGQAVGGGIVVYVDCTGQHGLIAATVDQGTAAWGCSGTLIGTTATYGTGGTNTTAIMAGCVTRPIAASLARNYTGGGFSDWSLPSSAELSILMSNYVILGLGNGVIYYSSTETSATVAGCMYQSSGNIQSTAAVKTYVASVRAVRYF